MAIKITPHLVHLTYEAALRSFWRKDSLRKFLRQAHVAETHLATWSSDESKRDFLDRTFASLQRSEKGKAVIGEMALFLAEQIAFPDLRNWEDSATKIQDASKAVAELKALIVRQSEEVRSEREREAVRAKAREERETVHRQRASLSELMQRLDELSRQQGTAPGGYAFQDWFYDLLTFTEIEHRRPYITGGRQIDGSLTIDGTTYLIELKFTSDQVGAPDIDIFRSKVESKADNTMGVFVSMAGYSSVAIQEASGKKTTLLLLDASHVYLVLSGGMPCIDVVRRVRRHASQTGESLLPVASFGG
ncbi:restriction endonuclease [Bordetella bronchiseptica]|uniref:restriction endonuclease n=1 Tax=Bordetella bronchiseptica TaxID=518 RepID=UPI0009B80506|nr:restriction endonuclease [Bordetella bronchiseptica]